MNHEELKQNRYQHTQSLIQQSLKNPNTEPQGEKDNADNSDKTVIYNPEEDETDPHNETAVTKGTKYYKTNRYLQSKKSNNQVPEEEGHVFSGRPTTTVDRLA